jgi:hypothetical protein
MTTEQPAELPGDEGDFRAALTLVAAAVGEPAPGEGRALPSISKDSDFRGMFHLVGQTLRNAPLFRRGEDLVTVSSTGEEAPMTADRFRSWHQQYFTFHSTTPKGGRRTENLAKDLAVPLLAADIFRDELRELRTVANIRLPVWRGGGEEKTIALLPEGYDPGSKTFTVPTLDFETDWPLEDSLLWLESTFGGFPFYETGDLFARRSFAAHVAAMLGVFTTNLLPKNSTRPMVVANGNQPGLGKTLLIHAALSPVHGEIADDTKPRDENELRKLLSAVSLSGKPYLFLDDCSSLQSTDLNKFVTSPVHEPRTFHTLNLVRCPNRCQILATGNGLNLTSDLERRALVVDLFCHDDAMSRDIRDPLTNSQVFSDEYRRAALGAMWALVRHWNEKGRPICREAQKPSFESYASLVGSIVVAAGFANPFAPRQCTSGGDEAGRALERVIASLAGDAVFGDSVNTDQILAALREDDTLDLVAPFAKNDIGQRQTVGHKLRKLRGRTLTDSKGRRFEFGRREDAHGARYTFHFLDAEGA